MITGQAAHGAPARSGDPGELRMVADELTAHAGLAFRGAHEPFLTRAVERLRDEAGPLTVPSLLASLRAGGPLLERLLVLATVPETYFFRDPEELEVLQREFLRPAIRRAAAQRPLRIWSVGCATGEETYSLGVLLEESGAGDATVLGTDLNRASLAIAREAVYGSRSFRAPLESRERWFEVTPMGRRVSDRVRRRVTFRRHNLTEPTDAPLEQLGGRADVIVCRNVLLYFDPAAREAAVSRLFDALAPGGWLLVAPVEHLAAPFHRFERLVIDGRTFLRRPEEPARVREDPGSGRATVGWLGMASEPTRRSRGECDAPTGGASSRAEGRWSPEARVAGLSRDPLDETWVLADRGDLAAARTRCEALLASDPLLVPAYECLATIAQAQGDGTGAATALRRLVYLQPDDAACRFKLALLEWRRDRRNQARALLASSLKLLAARGTNELVDERTRLTVARARQVAAVLESS